MAVAFARVVRSVFSILSKLNVLLVAHFLLGWVKIHTKHLSNYKDKVLPNLQEHIDVVS